MPFCIHCYYYYPYYYHLLQHENEINMCVARAGVLSTPPRRRFRHARVVSNAPEGSSRAANCVEIFFISINKKFLNRDHNHNNKLRLLMNGGSMTGNKLEKERGKKSLFLQCDRDLEDGSATRSATAVCI